MAPRWARSQEASRTEILRKIYNRPPHGTWAGAKAARAAPVKVKMQVAGREAAVNPVRVHPFTTLLKIGTFHVVGHPWVVGR